MEQLFPRNRSPCLTLCCRFNYYLCFMQMLGKGYWHLHVCFKTSALKRRKKNYMACKSYLGHIVADQNSIIFVNKKGG
ncbi:hypothetical protein B0I24_103143 [Aliidiomarina maris]|uniref:Uncharacterized protein n=1 Tax=Aliidiomarina maris TaxID=531312 RepID=A0A327X0B2_9GAMM|nr:hypothetical protein B0I24_103143 [Aliidiomarina maris]